MPGGGHACVLAVDALHAKLLVHQCHDLFVLLTVSDPACSVYSR